MLVINRILDFLMAVGAFPAIFVVVPLEEIFDKKIAGTWFAGTLAAAFGIAIIAVFIVGIVSLLP